MNGKRFIALSGILLVSLAGLAYADSPSELQGQVDALKARVAELEGKQQTNWLNERRAEEIKSLVRDVLSDADTRASLAETGMSAGHNGKNFFLRSEDGKFLLNLSGYSQFRYVYNNNSDHDNAGNTHHDNNEAGFELARVNLGFSGHIGSPKIGYAIGLMIERSDEYVLVDYAYTTHELAEGLTLKLGEFKAPFLREQLTADTAQLAVEASQFSYSFGAGRVQGVALAWDAADFLKIVVSYNDGIGSGEAGDVNKDFDADETDYAFTGRADLKLAGNWAQKDDFTSWSGEPMGLFLGGAIHYEVGETGDGQDSTDLDKILALTVDSSLETGGFSIFGAFAYTKVNSALAAGHDRSDWGVMAQAAYNINDKIEPFVRWEWIKPDSDLTDDDLQILTFGVNYYVIKHAAKFTLDVMWCLDPVTEDNTFGGPAGITNLLEDTATDKDQLVVRGQFQIMF
jgi:hypothetical protein